MSQQSRSRGGSTAMGDIARKKDTGEPGNGGQFGHTTRSDSGLSLSGPAAAGADSMEDGRHSSLADPLFSEDVVETFTTEHCSILANVMHERTGWPVVVMTDSFAREEGETPGWVHAAVRAPDGRIVDVEGWHTEQDWVERWGEQADILAADEEYQDQDEPEIVAVEPTYGSVTLPFDRGSDDPDLSVTRLAGRVTDQLLAGLL